MAKRVVIRLGKDGSVKVEAEGFTGQSCEEATKFLDTLFGSPAERDLKPEYFQQEVTICDGLPSGHCG